MRRQRMNELKRLYTFARPYWKYFLAGIVCLIFCDLLQLFVPAAIKVIVDSLVAHKEIGYTSDRLASDCLKVIVIAFVMFVSRWAWRRNIMISSRKIERDVRHAFFQKLLRLPAPWYDRVRTGDLMARATSDVLAIQRLSGVAVFSTIDAMFLTVFSLYCMFWLDWKLTAIAIIPLPLISLYIYLIGRTIHTKADAAQESFGKLSSIVQETFAGIRVIKDFGQEDPQEEAFSKISEDYLNKNLTLALFSNSSRPIMHLMIEMSFALTLLYGGWRTIETTMTLGTLIAFMGYLHILIWPVIAIGWVINLFHRGLASMARIGKILDSKELKDGDRLVPEHCDETIPAIEFRNLTFSYGGEGSYTDGRFSSELTSIDSRENARQKSDVEARDAVLTDVSFEIPLGSTLGIVGTTGSGKSSLLRLLLREYDPTKASIFIHGIDVCQLSQDALRKYFSVVPQDSLLFTGTIRDNIIFGMEPHEIALLTDSELSDKICRAAEISGIMDEIDNVFPSGFDTVVGEKGLSLSGGQRQRLAIARALILERPVIILDDCLSAVDTETEEKILTGIKDSVEQSTSIIVSNRLSSLRYANEIIVLDKGRVVQRGSHQELVLVEGIYSELFHRQQLEHSIEEAD